MIIENRQVTLQASQETDSGRPYSVVEMMSCLHANVRTCVYDFVCVPLSSSKRPFTICMISLLSFSP